MRAKTVHCPLERELEPVALDPRHTHALLVATLDGIALGEVLVPAEEHLSPEDQRRAIDEELGDRYWEERLRAQFNRAARAGVPEPDPPSVSVVVRASGEAGELLERLGALDPPAIEVIVVDEAKGEHWVRRAAAARGEVVAVIDADTVVEVDWLAGLGEHFADPLVMAVTGYTAPLELGDPGAVRGPATRAVYDIFSLDRVLLQEGNCFIRRTGLGREGRLAQLYQRLIEAGYRIVSDTGHIAWRRGPQPEPALVRARHARGELPGAVPASPVRVEAEDPNLSVAIASYNRREPLAEVLMALGAQSYPAARYEVVAVLDGSTDGSAERARSLELPYRLRVIEQENSGLAASRNRGARESDAPVVIFLDDDIVPEPDFLAAHASAHRAATEPRVALGTCPPADLGQDLLSLRSRHWWTDYYRRRSRPDHQWTYVDFGDGNVSFPREVLRASGGWDEEFARQTVRRQDWELGIRLLQSGVRFVDCPGARGLHHFELSFATALRNRRVEGRADVLLATKHPHVRNHLFLVTLLRMAAASRRSSLRVTTRAPKTASLLLRPAGPVAQLIERAGLRSLAWRAMPKLLANSYLAGIRDALPTREEYREFIDPIVRGEGVERFPLALDSEGRFELPPAVGAAELELTYGEEPLTRVEALEPELHWDWDALEERIVREALRPYRAAAEPATAAVRSA